MFEREIEPFLVPEAELIAKRVFDAPETSWRDWKSDPPKPEDGQIVGRDAAGYCHLATHLIGVGDGFWADSWMPVPFAADSI